MWEFPLYVSYDFLYGKLKYWLFMALSIFCTSVRFLAGSKSKFSTFFNLSVGNRLTPKLFLRQPQRRKDQNKFNSLPFWYTHVNLPASMFNSQVKHNLFGEVSIRSTSFLSTWIAFSFVLTFCPVEGKWSLLVFHTDDRKVFAGEQTYNNNTKN